MPRYIDSSCAGSTASQGSASSASLQAPVPVCPDEIYPTGSCTLSRLAKTRVLYFGSSLVSSLPKINPLGALAASVSTQIPKDFKNIEAIDSWLFVVGSGIQLAYVCDPCFLSWFPIQKIVFIAAVKCSRENGTLRFIPLDSSEASTICSPPIFYYVTKRTNGMLESHGFVCKSDGDALTIIQALSFGKKCINEWSEFPPSRHFLLSNIKEVLDQDGCDDHVSRQFTSCGFSTSGNSNSTSSRRKEMEKCLFDDKDSEVVCYYIKNASRSTLKSLGINVDPAIFENSGSDNDDSEFSCTDDDNGQNTDECEYDIISNLSSTMSKTHICSTKGSSLGTRETNLSSNRTSQTSGCRQKKQKYKEEKNCSKISKSKKSPKRKSGYVSETPTVTYRSASSCNLEQYDPYDQNMQHYSYYPTSPYNYAHFPASPYQPQMIHNPQFASPLQTNEEKKRAKDEGRTFFVERFN